jgi:toxin FitB
VSFLLDTTIVSELRKASRCAPAVASWFARVSADEVFLSVLTIGEIRKGVESIRRRDSDSAGALDRWLHDVVNENTKRILPVDLRIAEEWGRMNVPDPLPVVDGLLAATARVHGLTLVTRNVKDMARVGIPCLDPFAVVG